MNTRVNNGQALARWPKWVGYPVTILLEAAVTAGLLALQPYVPLGEHATPYVIVTMAVAYWFGEGPALLAFFIGGLSYDYFFIPPLATFLPFVHSFRGWASLTAFFFGSALVALVMIHIRRSQRRTQLLANNLRESNERTTNILESTADAYIAIDREWRFTYVNPAAERLLQRKCDELVGNGVWDLFPEAVGSEFYNEYHRAMAEQASVEFEEWYPPLGACFWVRVYPSRKGLFAYFRDITERKVAEEARQTLASIVEHTSDAVISKALDGTILTWNKGAERIYGYSAEEVVGRSISALVPPGYTDEIRDMLEKVRSGEPVESLETVWIRKDGALVNVSFTVSPVRNAIGEIIGASTIARDITETVRLRHILEYQLSHLRQALAPPVPMTDGDYRTAAVYLPAFPEQQIGGDFYDVFMTERGQIGIVIGDVSGKGVEAAALAAAARSTIHSFAYELSVPGIALTHANAVLESQEVGSGRFVTVLLIVIDPETGSLSYAAAGHPPAAIWRADGQVTFLEGGNLVMGILAGQEYVTVSDCMDPGDKIVLYTDGILETRHGTQFFDVEGIRRALVAYGPGTPDEVAKGLLEAARQWADGPLRDDVAILVIERESKIRNSLPSPSIRNPKSEIRNQ